VAHIFCLREKENELNIVGELEDIGAGEQISAIKFAGPRGYVSISGDDSQHHLLVLDLSDSFQPVAADVIELPIDPGYVHTFEDTRVLILGKYPNIGGVETGLGMFLYDIPDIGPVTLSGQEPIGVSGTSSEAFYDPMAFAYHPAANVFSLPVSLYEDSSSSETPSLTFKGRYIYRITTGGDFEYSGRIEAVSVYGPIEWSRSKLINDTLYAVWPNAITAVTSSYSNDVFSTLIIGN
jgi:hypothetical protein